MKLPKSLRPLLILVLVLLMVGCQTEEITETTETTPPQASYLTIAENKFTAHKLVFLVGDESLQKNFAADLLIKTGAKFEFATEEAAGEKAIYIGTSQQLEGKGGVSVDLAYTTYEIKVDNGNVYVAMADESLAKKVIEMFSNSIVETAEGVYGIDENISGIKDTVDITETVPVFETASGKQRELYESGGGNYQITYQALNLSSADQEVAAYEQKLVDAGYVLHQKNTINQSQFFTYTKGDTMIHCNYFKAMKEFRIVYGPKGFLGSQTPIAEYEKKVTPSISIVGATDSVLSLVYQAPDGSFVIIDGGYGTDRKYTWTLNDGFDDKMTYVVNRNIEKDMASLWELLERKTPAGEKPQVTWMMTHGDPDHICLPPRFMKEYKDKFDLNLVCYNFPVIANVGLTNGEGPEAYQAYIDNFISAAKTYFPNANHLFFHTGQKLYLPGTEIEFLFTAEDNWPNKMPWMNDTCAVWRITSEGKSIMILGDTGGGRLNQMVRCFGDYLKSDILQLSHHGSNGGTLPFYRAVEPTVALWACEDMRFLYDRQRLGTKPGFEYNLYIRETVKYHYAGSYTHTILLPSLEEEK